MIMMGSAGKPDPMDPWRLARRSSDLWPTPKYGSREYSARDCDGHLWSFGTYDPYAGS